MEHIITVNSLKSWLKLHKDARLYLDFDDTSVKSVYSILSLFDTDLTQEDIMSWDFKEISEKVGLKFTSQYVESLFERPSFFENLYYYKGLVEFVREFEDRTIFLTKGTPKNLYLKTNFIKADFPKAEVIGLPINIPKSIINFKEHDVLVDDVLKNFNDVNCMTILFRGMNVKPWNDTFHIDGLYAPLVLTSWEV